MAIPEDSYIEMQSASGPSRLQKGRRTTSLLLTFNYCELQNGEKRASASSFVLRSVSIKFNGARTHQQALFCLSTCFQTSFPLHCGPFSGFNCCEHLFALRRNGAENALAVAKLESLSLQIYISRSSNGTPAHNQSLPAGIN